MKKIKTNKYSYIRIALLILFVYMMFGYFIGFMYKPRIVKDFNKQQYNNVVSVYNLSLSNNSKFLEIKFNSIMFDSFCVAKIDNVKIDEFRKNNPEIKCYKAVGSIWFLPAGFHRPDGNKVTCYYIEDTVYISTCGASEIYGTKINDLFWNIYDNTYSVKTHREYYVHPLFVVFCYISLIILTIIAEKQRCNLQNRG